MPGHVADSRVAGTVEYPGGNNDVVRAGGQRDIMGAFDFTTAQRDQQRAVTTRKLLRIRRTAYSAGAVQRLQRRTREHFQLHRRIRRIHERSHRLSRSQRKQADLRSPSAAEPPVFVFVERCRNPRRRPSVLDARPPIRSVSTLRGGTRTHTRIRPPKQGRHPMPRGLKHLQRDSHELPR